MFQAHMLKTCRGMKVIVKQILCIKLVKYWDRYTYTVVTLITCVLYIMYTNMSNNKTCYWTLFCASCIAPEVLLSSLNSIIILCSNIYFFFFRLSYAYLSRYFPVKILY